MKKEGSVILSERRTISYYDHHTENSGGMASDWIEKWKYEHREIKHHGWHDDWVEIDVLCSKDAAEDLSNEIQSDPPSNWVEKAIIKDDRECIIYEAESEDRLQEKISELEEIINPSPDTKIKLDAPLNLVKKVNK